MRFSGHAGIGLSCPDAGKTAEHHRIPSSETGVTEGRHLWIPGTTPLPQGTEQVGLWTTLLASGTQDKTGVLPNAHWPVMHGTPPLLPKVKVLLPETGQLPGTGQQVLKA